MYLNIFLNISFVQNYIYLKNPLYKDIIKTYIADIFNYLEEVPEELKFEGW